MISEVALKMGPGGNAFSTDTLSQPGLFHIHGNAADNDSVNIPLQLQTYTA
ncbi:hypothetical protein A2U01_0019383, partial [Trifolium medium]|nr:hypothetical protein [Trifolium medium]